MARFRRGIRVVYRGQTGTVGGSTYDEETGKYCSRVLLDGERIEDLIDVRKLSPLSKSEWFLELVENDKHEWTEQHIGNVLRNLPKTASGNIDIIRPPKYRGIPIKPYNVKGAGQLRLSDMPEELADQL